MDAFETEREENAVGESFSEREELPEIVTQFELLDREEQQAWRMLQDAEKILESVTEYWVAVSTRRREFIEQNGIGEVV